MTVDATAQPSYVCGVGAAPLTYQTVGRTFDAAAGRWPDRPALVVCQTSRRLTYGELQQEVDRVATGLLALDLQVGDRVGIWAPNCLEWVLIQYATAKAGLILVNINPACRIGELEHVLKTAGCKALVLADRFKSSDYTAMVRRLAPEIDGRGRDDHLAVLQPGKLQAAKVPSLRTVIRIAEDVQPGFLRFSDLPTPVDAAARRELDRLAAVLDPDDAINIQFTSGTTGLPKGATLSHFNILNNAFFVGQAMGLRAEDRICLPVPLYHCFGMVLGLLGGLTHGATCVLPGEGFDVEATLAAVAEERCSVLYGVPTMFIAELDHPRFGDFDLSSLRTGIMAGAPCPIEVMKRVVGEMHMAEVTIAYGMTETSPVSFQTQPDDPLERRVSTVGRVHPWVEVKIIDEAGRVVPRGQQGELLTRGYSVMRGYWGDPERTAQVIDEAGWMHSGDLATLDAEGYCNIVGRVKDMIIRGGENIYPREIEEFLYRHPKVHEVEVFGVPVPRLGEEVVAWVMLKDGESASEEEIRDFCREQIAHYKVPRHIKFVDAFPTTVTGKVQKFRMRELMRQELGLQEITSA